MSPCRSLVILLCIRNMSEVFSVDGDAEFREPPKPEKPKKESPPSNAPSDDVGAEIIDLQNRLGPKRGTALPKGLEELRQEIMRERENIALLEVQGQADLLVEAKQDLRSLLQKRDTLLESLSPEEVQTYHEVDAMERGTAQALAAYDLAKGHPLRRFFFSDESEEELKKKENVADVIPIQPETPEKKLQRLDAMQVTIQQHIEQLESLLDVLGTSKKAEDLKDEQEREARDLFVEYQLAPFRKRIFMGKAWKTLRIDIEKHGDTLTTHNHNRYPGLCTPEERVKLEEDVVEAQNVLKALLDERRVLEEQLSRAEVLDVVALRKARRWHKAELRKVLTPDVREFHPEFRELINREQEALKTFFGKEIEVPPLPPEVTPEKYKEWKEKGFELHYLPPTSLSETGPDGKKKWKNLPGWTKKPKKGPEEIHSDLPGGWLLFDMRKKPNYQGGKQMYPNDGVIGNALKTLRLGTPHLLRDDRVPKPNSRFGMRGADFDKIEVQTALAASLGINVKELDLPYAIENSLLMHMHMPEWGDTNVYEFFKDKTADGAGRFVGGLSNEGGLSDVIGLHAGFQTEGIGFRPVARLSSKK